MANDRARTRTRARLKEQNLQQIQGQGFEINNVVELQKILLAVNKLREEQQINMLVDQMQEMANNYSAVLQELSDVKEQLKDLQPLEDSQKGVLSQIATEVDSKVTSQYYNLQNTAKDLNEKAKTVVQRFKETGITALNKVCDFLGIKEKLIAMRDQAQSNAMTMQNSVEKIEKVESEISAAKFHAKNAVKSIFGKETVASPDAKKSKFFERIKAPYVRLQQKYSEKVEKLNKAIGKFDSLEKTVQGIKEKKKSLTEKLEDNKKIVESNSNDKQEHKQEKTEKQQDDAR